MDGWMDKEVGSVMRQADMVQDTATSTWVLALSIYSTT